MKTAYVGVGSNLGDKARNCIKAIALIDGTPGCTVEAYSPLYRTAPVGVEGQGWYVNGAVSVLTGLSARELLDRLLGIEAEMGRERKKKWDARIIDLDLLLLGQDVIKEESLVVPHPLMHLRRFVLVPMVQLARDLIHPVLGVTMAELLDRLAAEAQAVIPLSEA